MPAEFGSVKSCEDQYPVRMKQTLKNHQLPHIRHRHARLAVGVRAEQAMLRPVLALQHARRLAGAGPAAVDQPAGYR